MTHVPNHGGYDDLFLATSIFGLAKRTAKAAERARIALDAIDQDTPECQDLIRELEEAVRLVRQAEPALIAYHASWPALRVDNAVELPATMILIVAGLGFALGWLAAVFLS